MAPGRTFGWQRLVGRGKRTGQLVARSASSGRLTGRKRDKRLLPARQLLDAQALVDTRIEGDLR